MAKFKIGGAGPDGMGLGWIEGITRHRFDKSGEIYETDDLGEIQALRRCEYVEEIDSEAAEPKRSVDMPYDTGCDEYRLELTKKSMKELIKLGCGLFRVGMTKMELVDDIMARESHHGMG